MKKTFNFFNKSLLIFLLSYFDVAISIFEVKLNRTGLSYFVHLDIGSQIYNAIIDTGNPFLTAINNSNFHSVTETETYCLTLWEDGTYVYFDAGSSSKNCVQTVDEISLGNVNVSGTYTIATRWNADNPYLHNWNQTNLADIGLSYTSSSNGKYELSVFENIVLSSTQQPLTDYQTLSPIINSTNSTSFGLDFKDEDEEKDGSGSTMQIGYVQERYKDSLVWYYQPTDLPDYHRILIENFNLCGVNLMSNWSTVWPVLIDTGSACLTLPSEFYDTLIAYTNTSSVHQLSSLPSLSFTISGALSHTPLLIPIKNLIINSSFIIDESGAPSITISDPSRGAASSRLCILRGSAIMGSSDIFSVPNIVFGSLALRSLYFAADFSIGSVGLSNKPIDATSRGHAFDTASDNGYCAQKTVCIGESTFSSPSNKCHPPQCRKYSFVDVDESTQTCKMIVR